MVEQILGDRAKLDAEVARRKQARLEPLAPRIPTVSATDLTIQEIAATCERCKTGFAYQGVVINGRVPFSSKFCPACSEANRIDREAEEQRDALQAMQTEWETICPPLYRDTDRNELPISVATTLEVLDWQIGNKGIGLAGASGAGKTRLVFMLLKRLHFDGIRCRAMTAKRFENWCHRMFDKDDDARTQIVNAKSCKVLFIDDIGKEKYTERVESEFYDLIEHRTSHLLPILWTANASGDQLARMMGEDRGTPIVRRLREFSTVISV